MLAALEQRFPADTRMMKAHEFNSDGDTLLFYTYEYPPGQPLPDAYEIPLYSAEYSKETGLEYLALGDSFTSGEGDIEKKPDGSPYYLAGTEKNRQCHQSSRSYPYLLIDKVGMSASRMHSVACSGAQILPDYIGNYEDYNGQGQRLSNESTDEKEASKTAALSNFTPGFVPQIEFIKKYHPKTITIMGGGNDVGFASILEYCATPTWQGAFLADTCGYALKGHPLRKALAQTIQSQYDYTLTLLRKIRQASPETTVYVVGYPSFISENPMALCLNSALLDSNEREMINEAVTFMNTMLKDAAISSGVRYVTIQDSLRGGRMCEGSEYMTGLIDIKFDRMTYETDSFHPNAEAHRKFAETITSQGFSIGIDRNNPPLTQPIDLVTPDYFDGASKTQTAQVVMTDDTAVERRELNMRIPGDLLASNEKVRLTIYSDPVTLPTLTTAADGSLNQTVALPDSIKPGRHVLVLDALSPSGEPIEYFQFLTVASKSLNDQDGDGIVDDVDPCQFITSWIDEATNSDVCRIRTDIPKQPAAQTGSNATAGKTEQSASSSTRPVVSRSASADSRKTGSDDAVTSAAPRVLGASTARTAERQPKAAGWPMYVEVGLLVSTATIGYVIVRAIRN
jgi:lysophospholipase L1-like esterase